MPFWVQAHGVPLKVLNGRAGTRIGGRLGGLMEVEELVIEVKIVRSFLQMRVCFGHKQPLTMGSRSL